MCVHSWSCQISAAQDDLKVETGFCRLVRFRQIMGVNWYIMCMLVHVYFLKNQELPEVITIETVDRLRCLPLQFAENQTVSPSSWGYYMFYV